MNKPWDYFPKEKKRIIICEDDQGILELLKEILEEKGFQVKALTGGKGIQKKILEFLPDLILLDLWMPGMNGKEIIKILKKDDNTKNIPIIIVSALNETEAVAKNYGVEAYITKPFDIDNLLKTVRKYTGVE